LDEIKLLTDYRIPEELELDEFMIGRAARGARVSIEVSCALQAWLRAHRAELYAKHLRKLEVEEQATLAVEVREFFGHGRDINMDAVEALAGTYELYRPFHLAPKEQVSVAKMELGLSKAEPLACTMTHAFSDDFKEGLKSHYDGMFIPCRGKVIVMLKERRDDDKVAHSKFIGFIDKIDENSGDFSMLMIASSHGEAASCWPMYAHKLEKPKKFKFRHISRGPDGQFALPTPVREWLAKGAIYWQAFDFPRPFG
jgi:hypothetical protein